MQSLLPSLGRGIVWALLAINVVLFGGIATAGIHYVSPGLSIQDTINAASDGDTIRVWAGVYPGFININKSLVVLGSGPDTATTIQATTAWATDDTLDYPLTNFTTERPIVHIGSSSVISVVFEGFTIDGLRLGPSFSKEGTQTVAYSGILADRCTVTIMNNSVQNILPVDSAFSTWDSGKVFNGRGIEVRGDSAVAVIRRNYIQQVNHFNIFVNATDNLGTPPVVFPWATVDSNTIVGKGMYNGGQKGIWFNAGAWGVIAYNTISNLDYPDPSIEPDRASGIVIRYGYLNAVNGNIIHHNSVSAPSFTNNKGIYVQGCRDSVADNVVSDFRYGMEIHGGPSVPETVSVVRNVVTGGLMGIVLDSENGPTTPDVVIIGGSLANMNRITGQIADSLGGLAISMSLRDPLDGVNLESPIPVNARYNDLGAYTSAEVEKRVFHRPDTTLIRVDTVLYSPFWVPEVTANVKVFLQGPYVVSGDSMGYTLNTSLTLAAHFVGRLIPALAVDSINIELRDSLSGAGSTKRLFAPAWLMANGTIRDFNDTTKSYVQVRDTVSGTYYCVVRHRNHLAIMTPSVSNYEGGPTPLSWDFSTGVAQAYGINPMKFLGSRYVMWAGDSNGNGSITASDRALWQVNNGTAGYIGPDLNLSGQVTASDRALWQINNGLASQIAP